MRVRWTTPAIRNTAQIAAYLSAQDASAATRIMGRIDKVVGLLATPAELGRQGKARSTRELKVAATNYVVVYRIRSQQIDILAVFHDRQDRPTSYSSRTQ